MSCVRDNVYGNGMTFDVIEIGFLPGVRCTESYVKYVNSYLFYKHVYHI